MDFEVLKRFAASEFGKYNLDEWKIIISSKLQRKCFCRHVNRSIELSDFFVAHNPDEIVIEAFLHEVAHAIAGPYTKHGRQWMAAAAKVGVSARACDELHDGVNPRGRWRSTCQRCKRVYIKSKRSNATKSYRCGCGSRAPLEFEEVTPLESEPPIQPPHLA